MREGQAVLDSKVARPFGWAATALALALFLTVGGIGVDRYLRNFWLYRGFAPPVDPTFVVARGTTDSFDLASPALGARRQQVLVYLPPGYAANPRRRYPVFYLLHGSPGRPSAFLLTLRMGVVEDVLSAQKRAQPLILVMPFGSTGTFTDKEWANGYRAGEGWATFVARDVVRAVDARYRTIPAASGRALGGLSEGGYGALNIGLHHPREFHVLESWSGYEKADPLRAIFGGDPRRLALNSPLKRLPFESRSLRRTHTFIWFYSGTNDRLGPQNARFAHLLKAAGVPHRYFVVRGGHNWAVWRENAARAYLAAAKHLAHG